MKALAARRHDRRAPVLLLLLALLLTGGLYAVLAPTSADATPVKASTNDIATGEKLFQANCATCHGPAASGTEDGPSLIGVGAASVDFQVGTGRMPMQANGPQALAKPVQFEQEQINQLAAFVASLGAGPAIPTEEQVDPALGDVANGMLIFRTNCAMCHNAVGAGGALSEGKFAPNLWGTTPTHLYEAMQTGPQSMPVFNDANITPEEKRDVIAYVADQGKTSPGGLDLGSLGPVSEGLWAWVVGMGLLISAAVWIGAKSS
ncbi:cytochrome bc1 complex diheme cytochrome c subunit [Cellulomonas fengjieae]|uniref:Cytochrome bc1 complex cytochrome c subunit n=1 Tax=Cellulomonas fengjieae TaxID=2819978 RepID=A0ABS3SF91_9CELL|nr:c-type cytochrome [Cellulomonas fengjieae]MBO3084164.1 c-type cytochrome [Cellulomonas fengjieae]MBO3103616.1 c-type cytochrome [Cellulomonas fengjieae]QVI64588.1 c-type cytochrome [Cellulomonas fengjieae]